MIEIKLKLENNEEIKTFLPNSWGLLTCEQTIKLFDINFQNKPLVLEVLTGISSDLWKQANANQIELILKELEFLNYNFDFTSLTANSEIEIDNKIIKVPQLIEFETWGQKLLIEEKIKEFQSKKELNLLKLYPFIVAVYLQRSFYNSEKFDERLVDELEQKLMKCKAIAVYPIAGFFLLNLISGMKLKLKSYNRNMKQSKFRLELKTLLNSVLFPQ